jgi:hypothetical protein
MRLTPAAEVWEWLQTEILADTGSIHNEDHAHLLDADIRIMWASSSFEKQGRSVFGQAEQVAFRSGGWQKARMEQQMRDWFFCWCQRFWRSRWRHCSRRPSGGKRC